MGQGTLILGDPGAVDNPFFLLFPGRLPAAAHRAAHESRDRPGLRALVSWTLFTAVAAPRTGVFFTAYPDNTPLALRANLEHNHTVHETVVVISLEPLNVPHVRSDKREHTVVMGAHIEL